MCEKVEMKKQKMRAKVGSGCENKENVEKMEKCLQKFEKMFIIRLSLNFLKVKNEKFSNQSQKT